MALFAKKTCADILKEIRRCVTVIAALPKSPLSVQAAEELLKASHDLAKHARDLVKKLNLDVKVMRALENQLFLIGEAKDYGALRPLAGGALLYVEDLEKQCTEKLGRKAITEEYMKMEHVPAAIYGRMMTKAEYKRLVVIKALESAEPGELIPAFHPTNDQIEFFLERASKKVIHNIYALIGGTGGVDFVVFFKTAIKPFDIGPPRRYSSIYEVKFPHRTPIEIVKVRKV